MWVLPRTEKLRGSRIKYFQTNWMCGCFPGSKIAKNARDGEFLAILTVNLGVPPILALIVDTIVCGMLKLYRNQIC